LHDFGEMSPTTIPPFAPVTLAKWMAQTTAPLRETLFAHEIALAAQQLPLPHRDPADPDPASALVQ
jgi:PIN domain nuclease of toxin-antitoxin system